MKSAPHLLLEDRPEFERVLDEALRTAHRRPGLAALGERLNTEQLRTMALSAATAIAACAATEYERLLELRADSRNGAPPSGGAAPPSAANNTADGRSSVDPSGPDSRHGDAGLAGAMAEGLAETSGAGLTAIVSVLAPVLAGTAAAIFLVLGYLLHMVQPEPALAQPMRTIGWVFALLALAGVLAAMFGLLLTAVRNRASSIRAPRRARPTDQAAHPTELDDARAQWREALLERGILPFLREALADPLGPRQAPLAYVPDPPDPAGQRTPRLGYSHPDFSSHTGEASGTTAESATRPRYSRPDYSSPHYGGPEHERP